MNSLWKRALFALPLICSFVGPKDALPRDAASVGLAASVNGTPISAEEFRAELKRAERLAARKGQKDTPGLVAVRKKKVLENLIVRELLFQEAGKQGISVPDSAVAAELAALKARIPGQGELEGALERLGLTPREVRERARRGLVVRELIDRVCAGKVEVSDQEMAHYYEEHPDDFKAPLKLRLSHILVRMEPGASGMEKWRALQKIEALRKRVAGGEAFAAVAREASESADAKEGGDLGYFLPGQLPKAIEDAARSLVVNELSQVVVDRDGLHLLMVTELQPAHLSPLASVREKIRTELLRQREQKALAPYLKRLRREAQVTLLLEEEVE